MGASGSEEAPAGLSQDRPVSCPVSSGTLSSEGPCVGASAAAAEYVMSELY